MSEGGSVTALSVASAVKNDFQHLIAELREQNFDTIRFATYRVACKLRFIQKRDNLHLIDIWNIIESFRENGLNAVDSSAEVKVSRVELLLSTIYHNLNKRLPVSQQIDTDQSIGLLLSFLVGAYDRDDSGRLRVFSVKVALAALCAGKLADKLRYVFCQISNTAGTMVYQKFIDFLRELLALPTAVFEGPTFGYSEAAAKQCFSATSVIHVNAFLDTILNDPCPPVLMWLPLLHRMANVEHVFHPVMCNACGSDSFSGFRYKCQRCSNYQLCQDCFWRGRVSAGHTTQHEMKEYSSYKSPAKQLAHSIGKSLRCVPHTSDVNASHADSSALFSSYPERPLDLANIVPATPSLLRNEYTTGQSDYAKVYDEFSMNMMDSTSFESSNLLFMGEGPSTDDEHKLIARYTAKLGGRTAYPFGAVGKRSLFDDETSRSQRMMIARLERKNKEIVREIRQLEAVREREEDGRVGQQQLGYGGSQSYLDNGMGHELNNLRERKNELEQRMESLQETRRELVTQLDRLMKALKAQGGMSAVLPPTSGLPTSFTADSRSLTGIGGEIQSAFHRETGPPSTVNSLPPASRGPSMVAVAGGAPFATTPWRGDLLYAADSIANAMSTLLDELDDEEEGDSEGETAVANGTNERTSGTVRSSVSVGRRRKEAGNLEKKLESAAVIQAERTTT